MKKGKLSAEERARARLLEYWQHKPDYGEPIGCIATTYTFDAAFFEDHCLSRFVSMDTDPNEDPHAYLIEREEKLQPIFSGVLVDASQVPTHRSLRWVVLPVHVPNGGLLHAKLSLLVWQHRVRVIVASANLTEAGYRANLEVAGALDFVPEGDAPLQLLIDLLDFVDDTRRLAPGLDQPGAQDSLRRFLQRVREHVGSWNAGTFKRGEPEVALAMTGPERPNLFEQLRKLWRFSPATNAWVVSPYFDDGDRAIVTAKALEDLLIRRDNSIEWLVDGRVLPDGTVELDMPASLKASTSSRTTYLHARVVPNEGEELRRLHAKSIWIERDGDGLYSIGSSNFTQLGTGVGPAGAPRHVELNLVYIFTTAAPEFRRICANTYPASEEVDTTEQRVSFLQRGDKTPDDSAMQSLPLAFGTATVYAANTGLDLEIELAADAPAQFVVSLPTREVVLRSDEWARAGRPTKHRYAIGPAMPPSFLTVTWSDETIEAFRSTWPVNVADAASLPVPKELRELSLEDLLLVLTSARPAHEVIAKLIKSREATHSKASEYELDPHKKVQTAHHLLKRMRRAAAAMEELRSRIERPTFSRDALRARLLGPLGPLALASRLVAEEPAGAAFMIAELATTLAHAKLDARGDLSPDEAAAEMRAVIVELRLMAEKHPAPKNLTDYVQATFREVCP